MFGNASILIFYFVQIVLAVDIIGTYLTLDTLLFIILLFFIILYVFNEYYYFLFISFLIKELFNERKNKKFLMHKIYLRLCETF